MACVDCNNNCTGVITTDKCVEYTGPDIACLGICKGDNLFALEAAIAEKLCAAIDGTGIDLSDVEVTCDFLLDLLDGEDQTLVNMMQMLATATCTLRDLVQTIQDTLDEPFTVVAPCLTTLPASPTRDEVLIATAAKVCAVSTIADTIAADYVKASELCTLVEACLDSGGGLVQEYTKMPKYVAMAYMGPLSVFDSTGKGLTAFGYEKVYICNGNNGTQDMRGRAAVGANTNVVGPALDAAVDPALSQNAGYSIVQNTKKGTYTDTLTLATIPAHNHTVTDPGHTHPFSQTHGQSYTGSPTSVIGGSGASGPTVYNFTTSSATTGATIGSTGSGQPHNNMQSSFGVVWVVYLP